MSPTLFEGDIVAWTPAKIQDIKVGDVIVFKSYINWPNEKIVVHRVTQILTDDNGNILLETKGDKNEYVDQAGPHIPEPYIRADHVMGKVMSVAQTPLRVPFIGYLGIWVSQGLESLSQPTTTKESSSYIGIFAPLTISAVILVALIFILPERAKTFKEKIHLNIFGHRPLNLKRTIITFLVAYVVFLTVIHVFANDSIVASVGIDADSPKQGLDFGRIVPGKDSFPKDMPVINPSIMPVKGVVFAKGDMKDLVTKNTFQLETGETKSLKAKVVTTNVTQNGSFTGQIMVYSSPLWLMFPDDFIQNLLTWNPEATVFILDLLSAVILTSITLILLISITFVVEKFTDWSIDSSWQRPSIVVLKKETFRKAYRLKEGVKRAVGRGVLWVVRADLLEERYKETPFLKIGKPIIASLIVIPILLLLEVDVISIILAVLIAAILSYFICCKIRNRIILTVLITTILPIIASLIIVPVVLLLEDELITMILAVVISGILAYSISCKLRNRIVLTVLITAILATTHIVIQSNLTIMAKADTMLELMALALGATGIYLLLFSVLLIPLALISWLIIRFIRNLKERKDPLLSLEGSCDL